MTLDEVLKLLLENAPDPNEPIPISNRAETLYGTVLPFLILIWVAVGLRMWVRLRVMHEPGWDDAFVILAAVLSTGATAMALASLRYGYGYHYLYIGADNMVNYIKIFYFENALYVSNTAIIKISLLLQYLRIFRAGTMRLICVSLLVIVSLWGFTYSFMAWFPCFPVQAYWHRAPYPNAKCYGYGFGDIKGFIHTFESHTALNMVFDVTIFFTPMILFRQPNLRKNNLIAMGGVFMIGATSVFTSIWRLQSIVVTKAATAPYLDFTWLTPISIILSALEVDLAIISASMPVFWPVIDKSFTAIFVTHEVQITEHRRLEDDDQGFELQNKAERRNGSMKSENGNSIEGLSRQESSNDDLGGHYRDRYNMAHIDPFTNDAIAIETVVATAPKEKWRM